MKKKSYDQKAAAYWAIIRNNPDISSAAIGRRYKGTALSMRKQDRDSLVKEFKGAATFQKRINNSNAADATKQRLTKKAYSMGKKSSLKGRELYPPEKHTERKTMKEVIKNTFEHTVNDKFEKYTTEAD